MNPRRRNHFQSALDAITFLIERRMSILLAANLNKTTIFRTCRKIGPVRLLLTLAVALATV
jgi:hypothetical protein